MSVLRQRCFESDWKFVAIAGRWLAMLAVLCLLGGSLATAQEKKDKEKSVEDKTLASRVDNWPLRLTYYRSKNEGREASVVVLLHMKGKSRLTWTAPKGFAEQLQDKGFAVIAVDLRKHGQSKPGAEDDDPKKAAPIDKDKSAKKSASGGDLKQADYQLMVSDMDDVKKFIFEEHEQEKLNMRKMAIVAPEMSAAIAIQFAQADWLKLPYDDAPTLAQRTPRGQDVQAMIFLSPETTLPGVPAHLVAGKLKGTPMAALVIVGKTDTEYKDQAKKLFQLIGGDPAKVSPQKKAEKNEVKKPAGKEKEKEKEPDKVVKERLFYGELPTKLRGTDLLGTKLDVEGLMLDFLQDHVQKLKGPVYEWRKRKSREAE